MSDKLDELFSMQSSLNDRVFKKQNILSVEDGSPLTSETLINRGKITERGPNTDTNRWLNNFLNAMEAEGHELREELLQKWWSKDHLDMQNIRVEIIDQLHFWISLAMTAGMTADDVYRIYRQKNEVNLNRQEQGYSRETKENFDDNKDIK